MACRLPVQVAVPQAGVARVIREVPLTYGERKLIPMNIRHCMRRGLSAGLACLLLFAASCSPDADMPGTTTGTDRETGTAGIFAKCNL